MHSSCSSAAPGQLHATIPGLNGTHACLSLYDVCPHTSRSVTPSVRRETPYLYHDVRPSQSLALPSTVEYPRTVEWIDNNGKRLIETTHSTLLSFPEPHFLHVMKDAHDKRIQWSGTTRSVPPLQHPEETAMTASLARLFFSKNSPTTHHVHKSTTTPLLRPTSKASPPIPTIYLLSFSTDRTPTTRAFATLLNKHLPVNIALRYTIDARKLLVPPRHICENYSGIAVIVQEEVLRDWRARKEIDYAVDDLTKFFRLGGREGGVAVCCTAGTHRSVAIAELIALRLREEVRRLGSAEGVKIVVKHIHRVKGARDAY